MVPRRLERNVRLHEQLRKGLTLAQMGNQEQSDQSLAIPIEWNKIEQWICFVVRGLTWFHWQFLLPNSINTLVYGLTDEGEAFVARFDRMRAANRIRCDLGHGTIVYEAIQSTDDPTIAIWKFWIYGGAVMADLEQGQPSLTKCIVAMVAPSDLDRKTTEPNTIEREQAYQSGPWRFDHSSRCWR